MNLSMRYAALLAFNALYIMGFAFYYLTRANYEFMVYIGVLVVLVVCVSFLQRKIKFPLVILWMLSIWGLLHMMGGGVQIGEEVLYRWVPLELYNAHDALGEFVILKFDQILHFYIYFVMSFVLAHVLVRLTKTDIHPFAFYLFVVLGSVGASVFNELIEFAAFLYVGHTGVGGYINTLLDLCFNTAGAVVGALGHFFFSRRV